DQDTVTFSTGGSNHSITLNVTATPSAVTFNQSNGYTISGTGGIAGLGGLTMSGTGTVNLNTVNTYAGPTVVSSGTLTIGSSGSIASATVSVASGASLTVVGGISSSTNLTDNGAVTFSNAQNIA